MSNKSLRNYDNNVSIAVNPHKASQSANIIIKRVRETMSYLVEVNLSAIVI